jgi:hypothetical protein
MLSIFFSRYCFFYFGIGRSILFLKFNYLNAFLLPCIASINITLRLRNLVSLQEFKLIKGLLLLERLSSQAGIFINWKKSRLQVQVADNGVWCIMRVNIRNNI